MKTSITFRTLATAAFAMAVIVPSIAGPGPQDIYTPVASIRQAEKIKPGTRVAMECGHCGAIKAMAAADDRPFLHGYTCPVCKKKYVVQTDAHGGVRGFYVSVGGSAHKARLLRMR